jgi:hypothetical protein
VRAAVVIEHACTLDTQHGFEGVARVVEAAVDHLGVATAGLGSYGEVPLQQYCAAAGMSARELPRDREADDAAADDLVVDKYL